MLFGSADTIGFSFHLRSIENFLQNRELVLGKHCASPSRFWVYCGGRPMSKVPYELSTLGVVFRDFFQDSEVILASNFKMFMSMKCEVLYQVDWARNDQLEWLRLIFAVYRDPSGSGSVDDTSRITGEVLQKFYASWGLQPTAVNAALLDQMWSKWYPGIPHHTADAILWASSFRFQSVLCWWEVNGIDAVLGIDHSRHTLFLSSILKWQDSHQIRKRLISIWMNDSNLKLLQLTPKGNIENFSQHDLDSYCWNT